MDLQLPERLNVEQTIGYLADLIENAEGPDDVEAALTAGEADPRRTVANWAAEERKRRLPGSGAAGKPANPPPGPPEGQGASRMSESDAGWRTDQLPTRFVCLKGCPRMMWLEDDVTRVDATGHAHVTPGVRIDTRPFFRGTKLRSIDLAGHEAVRRSDNRKSPQELAAMLMATPYYQRGIIVSLDDWQAEHDYQRKMAAKREKEDAEHRMELLSKRGKRGAA